MVVSSKAMQLRHAILIPLVTIATACGQSDAPAAAEDLSAWTLSVQPMAMPTDAGGSEPRLTVSNQGALLSWIESNGAESTLRFVEQRGEAWSEAGIVTSGSNWFRSYADTPSVLRLSNGTLVANYLPGTDLFAEAYDLHITTSTDDGVTWSEGFRPHDDGTTTQHGFAAFYEPADGGFGVLWLDGRQQELDTEDPEGGAMSLRHAVYDASWNKVSEVAVDTRVCECCPLSVGLTDEGPIVAFRDRSDRNVRDIHVSRFDGRSWSPSSAVHDDGWQLLACPVNGPVVSANGRQVAVAWFTAVDAVAHAYVAFSEDGGQSFGPPIQLDDNTTLGRVDVELLPDGSALASWLEYAGNRAKFQLRRLNADGDRSPAVTIVGDDAARPSGYPHIALSGNAVIIAWTESVSFDPASSETDVRVRTAIGRLN